MLDEAFAPRFEAYSVFPEASIVISAALLSSSASSIAIGLICRRLSRPSSSSCVHCQARLAKPRLQNCEFAWAFAGLFL